MPETAQKVKVKGNHPFTKRAKQKAAKARMAAKAIISRLLKVRAKAAVGRAANQAIGRPSAR